jgi:predicted membrane protein
LKLNGTHQLLVYADYVNMLGGSIHTIRKNTEVLVITRKEMGLEVNSEKTKYMGMSRDQNAGQNGNIQIINYLKLWNNLNNWEQLSRIKIPFMKTLRAD